MKIRFQNEKIKILDDESYYYITYKENEMTYKVTHNPTIIKDLRKLLKHIWIEYDPKRKELILKKPKILKKLSLRAYLMSRYCNMTIKNVRKHNVALINRYGDKLKDYSKANLVFAGYGSTSGENTKRRVSTDGRYIYYQLKADGMYDYATYHPVLYNILCLNELHPRRNKQKRLRFTVSGEDGEFYISQLAYACYTGQVTSMETYKDEIRSFKEKNKGYHVDHVNGDINNQCRYNLALVTREENGKKLDITNFFSEPYFCRPVILANGKYRVELGYCTEWMTGQYYYVECNTHNDLTECIRSFYNLERAPGLCHIHGLTHSKSVPRDVYKWRGSVKRIVSFEESCRAYDLLSRLSTDELIIWEKGSCWAVCN